MSDEWYEAIMCPIQKIAQKQTVRFQHWQEMLRISCAKLYGEHKWRIPGFPKGRSASYYIFTLKRAAKEEPRAAKRTTHNFYRFRWGILSYKNNAVIQSTERTRKKDEGDKNDLNILKKYDKNKLIEKFEIKRELRQGDL